MPSILRLFVPPLLVALFAVPGYAQDVALSQAAPPRAQERAGSVLQVPARLTVQDAPIADALTELHRSSGIRVAFSPTLLPDHRRVSCDCEGVSVSDALTRILADTRLTFVEAGRHVLIQPDPGSRASPVAPATTLTDRRGLNLRAPQVSLVSSAIPPVERGLVRQGTVTGQVRNVNTEQPIASALVTIVGTALNGLTNTEGRFLIANVPAGEVEVQVQILGYASSTETVTVQSGGTAVVDFDLAQVALALDDLVVVGYTTQSRRTIAGSVATVQADQIEARQVARLEDALRGRVAGVNIRNSGQPGQSAVVDIRGRAFTADNSPLYVVDGMYLRELRNLNPEDVESIQVLKDASAASQYGAQAANGVVIITTRQGRASDGNRVTLRSSYGYSQMARLIPMMNAREWAELTVAKYENARAVDPTSPTVPAGAFEVLNGVNAIDTNWQREVTRPGHIQNHMLSVGGGTATGDASYFLSGGYTSQRGTLLDTDFDRITLRANSQIQRGRVTLGESITISRSSRSDPTTGEQGQLGEALRMLPAIPVRNTDGTHGVDDWGHGTANYPTFALNPVGGSFVQNNTTQQNEAFGTLFGDVDIFTGLSYRMSVGFRYNDDKIDNFSYTGTIRQGSERGPATLVLGSDLRAAVLLENLISYNRAIGPHSINATAGYTQDRRTRNNVSASRRNFADQSLRVLPAGTENITNTSLRAESRINSYLTRVSYSLLDRYVAEASFRRDGSSRFGPVNRWGNFWAGSLGWVMSDEAFFRDIPLLGRADFLRVRASHGTLGNQDFADYEWQANIASANQNYLLGEGTGTIQPGLIATTLNNPELRWQDNSMQNYGVDVGLLGDRLSVTAEYFRSKSGGLLARIPLPPSLGSAQDPFVNAGSIQNTGFELTLQYIYSRPGFQLNPGFNVSTLSNKVLSLGTDDEDIISGASRTAVGLPLGHFYLYEMCGIFQSEAEVQAHGVQPNAQPGDICWVDHNGDGQIDSFDRTNMGSPWPKLEGGFFVDGRFLQLDFTVGLRGSYGAKAFNAIRPALEDMTGDNNAPKWLEPWTPENPSNTTPRALWGGVGADNARGPSNRYLESASYLKVQNIQLGYTFGDVSAEPLARGITGFLRRAGIDLQRARVYVNVQDIHTFTNYLGWDPEFRGGTLTPGVDGGTRYPNPRTYSFGIDLSL